MDRFQVAFAPPVQTHDYAPAYRLNEQGKRQWLQRFAFWLLSKTGAIRTDQIIETRIAHIDMSQAAIIEILEKTDLIQFVYHRRPNVILVGPDIYRGIITGDDIPFPLSHDIRIQLTRPGIFEWLDFEFVLVPHMKGILPLVEWKKW